MEELLQNQTELADHSLDTTDTTKPLSEAADALIAETAQCVRDYPLSAFAAAFGGGALIGWLIAHNLKGRL